jgi:FtsP/CotA-like multicopper oxidase with cupredoxin domain
VRTGARHRAGVKPGEVQRWRLLDAIDGDNLQLILASSVDPKNPLLGLGINVVAMDGITVPKTYPLAAGDPLVLGPGQRMDVMVKAPVRNIVFELCGGVTTIQPGTRRPTEIKI